MEEKAYLEWKPAITPEDLFSDVVGLAEIKYDSGVLYWLEMRPSEKGRYVIVRKDSNGTSDETPKEYNVRTRVHEYGGAAYTVRDGVVYFVNFKDQRLYCQKGKNIVALTPAKNSDGSIGKYASLELSPDGKYILFVYEKEFNEKENENFLACLELNGIENEPYILAKGRDFYADPAFSDGKVAWLEWDHPDMPWDSTELKIADFNGKLSDIKSVAGGKGIAICQPTFKNGKLYFVMDKTGKPEDDPENWWNIYVYDGSITAVTKELAEYGVPHWVFGQKRFDFIGEKLVTIRSKDGEDKIFCDTEITLPFDNFDDLVVGEKLYCTASQSGRGRALIAFDLKGDMEVIKRNTSLQMQAQDISAAKWIAYPTRDGKKSYAYLNLPKNSKYMASDEKPPLLVLAHGGPTSATSSAFSFVKQFWTSSGYAILDVDYRGSTGYGRAYRDALLAKWGLIDSDDVADGVQYLVKEGLVDSSRVAIRGGSAGGYMVQRQLTRFPDLFAVGASYFGIGNLITLVEETHKFESQYIDNLVGGKLPEAKKEYTARSPINHLNKLKAPMIIFQGSDDKIVTPENSREMAKILKEKGILHEYHEYPEEAHGFRKKENNVDSLNKEAEFYKKVFIRNVA